MHKRSAFPLLLSLALTVGAAHAQTVTIGGEIRERSEFDGRSPLVGATIDIYHLLRTRLAANIGIDDHISARIEVQDARVFGQTNWVTNSGSPDFDLRQGYLDVKNIGGTPFGFRVGRQMLLYANERVIGAGDWGNTGQSFDGIVATARTGDFRVDALGMAISRQGTHPQYARDVFLTGLWGIWSPDSNRTSVQAFYLFDDPSEYASRQNRHTIGFYTRGAAGALDAELDGALQLGDYFTYGTRSDLSASMIGARLGYTIGDQTTLRFGVGYDRLSGNPGNGSATHGEFSVMYGTTHKFYGLIDYLPPTSGYGLQDLMLTVNVTPTTGPGPGLTLELHRFLTATDPADLGLPGGTSAIGNELDLTSSYRPARPLVVTGGFAVFDGDPGRPLRLGRQTTLWGYLSTTLSF